MLASLALLQLALTASLVAPPGPLAGALAQADSPSATPAQPGDAAPPDAAPPDAAPPDATPPPAAAPAPAPAAPPAPAPAPAPKAAPASPARPRFTSLQGGETLGGAQAAAAWAGWSSLGAAWAMGVTSDDDAGALLDYDWTKSELRLGGLYRHALSSLATGGYDLAFRLTLSYYADLGQTYIYSENHSEHGLEVAPGIAFSQRAAGGLFSATADGPLTVTTKYRTGLLFSPRVGVAYETPLYEGVTVGARLGAGYRAGSGDAPLRTGRGELQFLVLATYRLL
jgi:hypothetical protein